MFRRLVSFLLRATLIPFLIREIIQKKRVTILYYHDIIPKRADEHFKTLKSKYDIISLKEYIEAKRTGKVNELPPKSLIITFDDGFKGNYELKPLLEKYGIPATIFLCSGIVGTNRHFWWKQNIDKKTRGFLKRVPNERRLEILRGFGFEEKKEFKERQALSKNEIEGMKNIVDFQSHTIFHPILTKCSKEKAYEEILQSKKDLENNYGFKIHALSYPNGDYSDRELLMAKKAGYKCGVTVDLGFNSQNTDLFRLKRIYIDGNAGPNELLVRSSGLLDFMTCL